MIKTFREIQREIQARIQNTSTSVSNDNDILPKVKDWANHRYERIYRSHPWMESIDDYNQTLTASTNEYVFDRDVDKLVAVFDLKNGRPIKWSTVQDHIRFYAPILDKTGNVLTGDPERIRIAGTHTVRQETSDADTINIASSSVTDISPLCVRVSGKTSTGAEIGENITLTGTTAATGSLTFSSGQKLQVSLGTTDGTEPSPNGIITVTETTSGDVLSRISPNEYAHKYKWFKVSPTPKSSGTQPTWNIWYQKMFRQMVNDNDIPIFDCCMEIIQGAFADALRDDGLEEEATIAEQQFTTMVIELQATQSHMMEISQFVPDTGPVVKFDNDAYLWIP